MQRCRKITQSGAKTVRITISKYLPNPQTSWWRGLPSWCWTLAQDRTVRWSRAWALRDRWRRRLASSPSWGCWAGRPCCGTASAGWSPGCRRCSSWSRSPSWCWLRPPRQGPGSTCSPTPGTRQLRVPMARLPLTLCMLNFVPSPSPCQWNSLKILESIWLLCASSSRVSPGRDLVRRCGGKPLQRRHSHDLREGSPSGSLTPSRRICFRRQWCVWW